MANTTKDGMVATAEKDTPTVENAAVEAQLQRILTDPKFQSTPQLSALLTHIVHESLAGRDSELRGTPIAQAVFKRDESFDSQSDTIVRVEAGRLRRRLAQYYETSGLNDTILIDIPKGGYVPIFHWGRPEPQAGNLSQAPLANSELVMPAQAVTTASGNFRARSWLITWLVFGALSVIIATWLVSSRTAPAPVIIGNPFVMVPPLRHSGTQLEAELAERSIQAVIADLTKISGISVMSYGSALQLAAAEVPLPQLREQHGVSHFVDGRIVIEQDNVRVFIEAVHTGSGKIIWAETINGTLADLNGFETALSQRVAAALSVSLSANESERIFLRHSSNRYALELFRRAYRAIYPVNEARLQAARDLYLRVVELDPGFAGGAAGLAQVHCYRVLFELSQSPQQDLEWAREYALEAITLDPDFGMGYAMLGVASTLGKDYESGLRHLRHAVGLQPGDPLTHMWLALSLLRSGRAAEAIAPLQEALRLDPLATEMPYHSIMGVAYYASADYEQALESLSRSAKHVRQKSKRLQLLRAVTLTRLGREQEGRALVAEVNAELQTHPSPIGNWLADMLADEIVIRDTFDTLDQLGLVVPGETRN